jgi:hypothetical protein
MTPGPVATAGALAPAVDGGPGAAGIAGAAAMTTAAMTAVASVAAPPANAAILPLRIESSHDSGHADHNPAIAGRAAFCLTSLASGAP